MTPYNSGDFKIDIFHDSTFKENSADNVNQYNFVYLDKSKYEFPTTFGINVYKEGLLFKSAVIGASGGGVTIHKNLTLLDGNKLLICCSNIIFCLSIPSLNLLWQTQSDTSNCFEIFKYQDSYIVHGELEISRVDNDGKILWQQNGSDVFTTLEGKDDFIITDGYISATDWNYTVYKFSFNGQLLE